MITIASLLDTKSNAHVERYWAYLENECNLSEIQTIPYPHFSWVIAAKIERSVVEDALVTLSEKIPPFTVKTTGLGIFTGESPVLYLPLIKTTKLISYHQMIWMALLDRAEEINHHYTPEEWMPHITIAYGDVIPEKLSCAVKNLAEKDLSTEIYIENLAFLSRIEDEPKIECVVPLQST